MYFTSDYLDNLSSDVETLDKNNYLIKEQFTDFSQLKEDKQLKLKFDDLHITLSKNGGLIALCMKQGHLDFKKNSKFNKNIIVMFQDSIKRFFIRIDWDNKKRYVICLDFTPKQELYAILNDGSVYKINYNEETLKQKISSSRLTEPGVIKAKFFEKGFIALTKTLEFYYIKDFKDIHAMLICCIPFLLFDINVDFIPIPAENTTSKKIELLITRQDDKGGIIQVPLKEDGENVNLTLYDDKGIFFEVQGASYITRETPHEFIILNQSPSNPKDKKEKKKAKKEEIPQFPKIENEGTQNEIGIICSIAISPTNDKIAFYSKILKKAFLFNSDFDGKYKEIYFNCKNNINYDEYKDELEKALDYPEGCQFLFCGEDTLALSFQRVIIISKYNVKNPVVYISSEENIGKGKLVSKCTTEIDGLRVLTNDGVFLISKVIKEIYNLSDEFSPANSKKLIDIYKNALNRKYKSNRDIHNLGKYLPDAIEALQKASANIYWTENNNEKKQKETQLFLLKVAQFAKKFVDKEEFNFDKFNQICKEMRIVNNLRNDAKYPIYITYKEYKEIDPQELISILIKYRNFQLAANISKFLDYSMKKVLNKYVMAIMKREINDMESTINKNATNEEIKEKYSLLFSNLEKVPGISFVKLAKKANKYGGQKLAMYLLSQEKSDLVKIPMLLKLEDKYDQTIKIAFDSYDFNAVIKVMDTLKKHKKDPEFMNILVKGDLQKYYRKILLYFKIYDKTKIIKFLEKTKNFLEIYYLNIKSYHKQDTFENRMEALKLCKSDLKNFDKNDLFDVKGAKKFIEKLEYITKFKKTCTTVEKEIIHYTETEPYKVSVYDCFKKGYTKEQGNWIESQNKNLDYSSKRLNLIKFRSYLEIRRPDAIENQLQKTPLKKLGLTPINLAEVFYDYKYYDKAAYWLIQVKDPNYYPYVVDMFKHMKKYKEWLEFVIASKNNDNKVDMVNEVLAVSPGLERFVEEYCNKYKVSLK